MPLSWKCDGQVDCKGGDDEKDCTIVCEKDQFMCADNSRCIAESWVCDGERDCEDGTDEAKCGDDIMIAADCDSEHFRCADGRLCLPLAAKCDGVRDCLDYSDEFGCAGNSNTFSLYLLTSSKMKCL
ncbi:unnamed protein product [Gongylonema pulchrum]|uniref:Uncharacterized protein n=1 Tax=Gongylonema pulchrum TaxID=637853 RepID=A0A3P7RNC0_9BILA|nr:unnamed protein product [Gongylonema pulchrum]